MSDNGAAAALAALGFGSQSQGPPPPDRNEGPLLNRVIWINLGISGLFVAARLWTKWRKTHRVYWDDGLIVLAWFLGLGHATQITRAIAHGLGRHMLYLAADERQKTIRFGVFSLICSFLSPMVGRIAFCVTILFLAGTDARVKKWPICLFMAGQLAVNISAICVFYTQCGSDLKLLWTAFSSPQTLAEHFARCSNPLLQTDFGYFQGSFNTVTDAFLTAMIASIVKTYEARALSLVLDYTYDLVPYVIWISIELNVVIIVSSLPLMRPLFIRKRPYTTTEEQQAQTWGSSTTFGSFMSKKGSRANLARVDSEEAIMPQNAVSMQSFGGGAIQVTREVSVTYQNTDQCFVHAALVGLIDGEVANPKLVQR
ncbi:hypothetical protein B0A55_01054 [Friedmanniomyces simplex]|uniref:Rhodopsin domain-containing protein n=1 Tax=Friedmanniomyces simplex TaxID=329884 RepID=A0A4U0XXU4_9PEZI|nr:hypothetical protein B0A55_01054 [Friedmanniomyces simplex]